VAGRGYLKKKGLEALSIKKKEGVNRCHKMKKGKKKGSTTRAPRPIYVSILFLTGGVGVKRKGGGGILSSPSNDVAEEREAWTKKIAQKKKKKKTGSTWSPGEKGRGRRNIGYDFLIPFSSFAGKNKREKKKKRKGKAKKLFEALKRGGKKGGGESSAYFLCHFLLSFFACYPKEERGKAHGGLMGDEKGGKEKKRGTHSSK